MSFQLDPKRQVVAIPRSIRVVELSGLEKGIDPTKTSLDNLVALDHMCESSFGDFTGLANKKLETMQFFLFGSSILFWSVTFALTWEILIS
jgi:hypothetical protein